MTTKCPHCGQSYEVEASMGGQTAQCSECGNDFMISMPSVPRPQARPQSYSAPSQSSQRQQSKRQTNFTATQNIPNYLWQSIVATVLCCLPLGIVGLVYSMQVNTKIASGDTIGAMAASKNAKLLTRIAFWLGALQFIFAFAYYVMVERSKYL